MALKTLIVDDEKIARESLKFTLLENCPEIEIIGVADSAAAALNIIKEQSPELLFLDVQMPDMDGFGLLNAITDRNFSVVFITAHNEHAIKAIKAGAFDYLLKPVDDDELKATVKKVIEFRQKNSNNSDRNEESKNNMQKLMKDLYLVKNFQRITIPEAHGYKIIDIDNIVLFEGNNNYTNVHLTDGKTILSTKTLKEYESIVDGRLFFRVHKSYIINLSHLTEFINQDGAYVVMSNKVKIPVSRAKTAELFQIVNWSK